MSRKNLTRLLIILALPIGLAIAPPARQAQKTENTDAFSKTIQPFLATNCYICHNASLKSGELDLEAYKTQASMTEDRDRWEKVLHKLRAGEMPPKGRPRPERGEVEKVCRLIESELERGDQSAKPDPGRVTARRLNRTEYNNTVRDLLGVDLRPADDFPQDDSGYGFDNIGDVLSLSPVLMEKYLAAAEKVARAAVFGPELLKPTLARGRTMGRKLIPRLIPLFDYDATGLSLPNSIHATHRFPVEGEYSIRALLGGVRPPGSESLQLCLWIDGQQVKMMDFDAAGVASFALDRQEFWGMAQDFRTRITAGDHWIAVSILHLYEGLPPDYKGPNPSKRPIPPPPEFKPPPYLPAERIAELKKEFDARRAERVPANDARISSLEVGGPYDQAKGPSAASLKSIYACGHLDGNHKAGCERKIVANLARRAYRRPVTQQEVNQLVSLITMARRQGDSFEEGIVQALQAMLVSPHFLFRIEKGLPAASAEAAHSHRRARIGFAALLFPLEQHAG